ncbi:cyclic nucleotide-binding-like protein [Zopfochytrium polystomum]|nr:cyclic nucleotide-binding-like protein [Zopfochytrium polystomum]
MDKGGKGNVGALLPTSLAEGWLERLTKFYLIPEGPFLSNWESLMVVLTLISCILITFMAAFHFLAPWAFIICFFIDFMFFLDIYIKFHVAYLQGGFWVVFPKEMALHYLGSLAFRFDVISNIPWDVIAIGWAGQPEESNRSALYVLALIRIAKLMRAIKIIVFFRRQEKKLHANFTVQILKFASYLITLEHSMACMWFAIACPKGKAESCYDPSWVNPSADTYILSTQLVENGEFVAGLPTLYIQSLYWTVTTMTTTGYGDVVPHNDAERAFGLFAMICGTLFHGYVSGTIASSLSNMDSRRVAYQQKMDAIRQYMTDRDMDIEMQERVLDYYDYMWERNKGIDVKNLFEDMPSTFRSEVALSLNNAIIDKATIFKGCSIGFRRHVAIAMRLYLFTANEFVIHKGDLGLEMYFITQGRIDVFSDDTTTATAVLMEGAHFGEFQIILNNRHEYSARAVCNTDIYVLLKNDLAAAFEAYPEDRKLVVTATEERYKQALASRKSRGVGAGGGGNGMGPTVRSTSELEEEFGMAGAAPDARCSNIPSMGGSRARKMSVVPSLFNRDSNRLSGLAQEGIRE